jgi:hypothetical protein
VARVSTRSSTGDENYLIKKPFTALGAIQIEDQARI